MTAWRRECEFVLLKSYSSTWVHIKPSFRRGGEKRKKEEEEKRESFKEQNLQKWVGQGMFSSVTRFCGKWQVKLGDYFLAEVCRASGLVPWGVGGKWSWGVRAVEGATESPRDVQGEEKDPRNVWAWLWRWSGKVGFRKVGILCNRRGQAGR